MSAILDVDHFLGASQYSADIKHWVESSTQQATCSVEPGSVQDVSTIVRVTFPHRIFYANCLPPAQDSGLHSNTICRMFLNCAFGSNEADLHQSGQRGWSFLQSRLFLYNWRPNRHDSILKRDFEQKQTNCGHRPRHDMARCVSAVGAI